MNYDEFIKKYNGKKTDYDGAAGVQCVDLIKAYCDEVFDIPQFSIGGSARFYFERFENFKSLTANFTKIKNTKKFVPEKGDVCVWGSSLGGGHGHVSIANGNGNTSGFYSFDQNYSGLECHLQYHNYKGFLGVLRPKDQSKITTVFYYPKYTGRSESIVDALKSLGYPSGFAARREIASDNEISGYIGTAKQNVQMLTLLKAGKLILTRR